LALNKKYNALSISLSSTDKMPKLLGDFMTHGGNYFFIDESNRALSSRQLMFCYN